MKKLYQKLNLFEKLGIFAIIITLVVTSIPYLNSNMLNAETDFRASLQLEEDSATKSKKLSVKTQEASFNKVILLLNDKEVSRSSISPDKPAVFYIQSNGTYTIQILDASDKVVETQKQEVGDFTELRIEPVENSATLKIIGRITGCDHFIVTFQDVKQEISITTIDGSSYSGEFTPEFNGIYSIACVDAKGNQLGSAITYEVTNQKDAPTAETPKDEPKNQNEIHINNETELKNIDKDPSKTYVLDRDIIITDTTSSTIVTKQFTGTLNGKGYQIKGLSQPLFASVKNARIENLALQGAWENKEGAMLAVQSDHSTYFGIAINADLSSKDNVAGMILTGDQDQIEKSYVSGSLVGKQVSGFVLNGKTTITSSYVSGLLSAKEEAYGFSKEADITNSHLIATVSAEKIHLFNQNEAKLENCYYDINLQELEEERAEALTTQQILALDLSKNEIYQSEKNSYPSIKGLKWSEEAKKSEALSRIALSLTENIHGITENINLPTKVNDVDMEWSSEGNLELSKNVLKANVSDDMNKDTSGILKMKSSYGVLAYDAGSASQLETSPVVGESLAEPTTHISFNAIEKHYYFIEKQGVTVKKPTTHKEAIDQGWKRYLWNGIINWSNLDWYTDYVLYDLAGFSSDNSQLSTYEIKTKQGLVGGTVTLSDGTAVGSQIIATLSDDALIKKGSWTWERSKSLAASKWEAIPGKASVDTDQLKSTYTPVSDDAGYYLRATFQVSNDLNYTGSVTGITSNLVTEALTSVSIYNKDNNLVSSSDAVVGSLLHAQVEPSDFERYVTYYWYHEGDENTIQGTGKEYVLAGKDVEKKLYVKAIARADGGASGEVKSNSTDSVQRAKTEPPTNRPVLVEGETTDISVTVQMPSTVHEGLYQFGYSEGGVAGNPIPFETYTRSSNPLTITGLKPNTTYYIFVRQIGENGYENSEWIKNTLTLSVKTEKEHIKGTVIIENDPVYGETLQASIENGIPGQEYVPNWYRVNEDNSLSTAPIASGETYQIKNSNDIGKRLRVVYTGTGLNAGEISAETDIVLKAEAHVPFNGLNGDLSTVISNTEVELQLPALDAPQGAVGKNESYIIGYSLTPGGVPIEYREDGKVVKYKAEATPVLKGFKHNTTYYFFLRYAETTTHYKSDWSAIDNCISLTTEKTPFEGEVTFTYATNDQAIQGEKLKAVLNNANTTDGTWSWTRINIDGSETPITSFFPEEGESATYIMIPNDDTAIGTRYKATFTPNDNYINNDKTSPISNVVEKYNKEKYPVPSSIPVKTSKTDTTISFKMESGVTGAIYQFKYSDNSDISTAKLAEINAYDGTEVIVTGLDRNKNYYVWVSQIGDQVKNESDYTTNSLIIKTEKTDLHGYVSIEETPIVNVPLTATYNKATYIPTGNDTGGTWQWYRKEASEFTEISGAKSNIYTPVTADIGKELKAVYTGSGDFQNTKEAVTANTRKPVVITDPTVKVEQIADQNDLLTVQGTFSPSNVWYRLQLSSEDPPTLPTDYKETGMKNAGWTKAVTTSPTLNKDYKGKNLLPKTSYTLYIVQAETDTTQASNIMSAVVEVGELTQKGSISFSGNTVVGKELTATLETNNNINGTWKWYVSNATCGNGDTPAPSLDDSSQWTQLSTGYYPSVNSGTSTLTISEDMFAKYIKVEFVANESMNYKGTIKSNASDYVKKIYEETLTLSSSTKDGNGNPKGYAGTVVTGTVNNYVESGSLNDNRTTVTFNIDTNPKTVITPTAFNVDSDNNTATFTYTLPQNVDYDGGTISAEVSKPKKYNLYVDKNLKAITTTNLKSVDTSSNFSYKYGIPINNNSDMKRFGLKQDEYADETATYVITDNIDMTGVTTRAGTFDQSGNNKGGAFAGTLDGDYHYLVNSTAPIFQGIWGTSESNRSEIKNIIFSNSNINGSRLAILSSYAGNYLVENVLLVDANVKDNNDSGMLISWGSYGTNNDVKNSGAAHGTFSQVYGNKSIGGLMAFATGTTFTNVLSVNSTMNILGGSAAGGLTRVGGTFKYIYSSNRFVLNGTTQGVGGISAVSIAETDSINAFWDRTLGTGVTIDIEDTDGKVYGKTTKELTGDYLKPYFEVDGNKGNWVYSEGFFPMLKWTVDKNVEGAVLYAATVGSFSSLDSKTTNDELFAGEIKGVIKVPKELQKSGYTYSSSNPDVLKVTEGGTVIPVGDVDSSADVIVTYNDPNTGAKPSATFNYTVKSKISNSVDVSITGKTNPGETLTASVSPSSGVSYQWYRRPQGTSDREPISGATGSTYTIKPNDIGMEINVDVTANGYATSSNYTAPITSVAPKGIITSNEKDNAVTVKAEGVDGANYEYAYATTDGGKKTIVGQSTSEYTINGLSRNTKYLLYARVAGADNGSYDPSPWSVAVPIETVKTEITGDITISSNVNMGDTLTASMSDTNLQTGAWKMERIDATTGTVTQTLTPDSSDAYTMSYKLTKEDAGSKIRISFVANGNFKDPVVDERSVPVSVETKELLLQAQTPPTAPSRILENETDHQLQVKETDSETGTQYQFGYRENPKDDITPIEGIFNTNDIATIKDLKRNTIYYIYARKAGKDDYEPSPWSAGIQISTKKTNIGTSVIKFNGTAKVDQDITFTVENSDDNVKGQTGLWVLERVGTGMTNTLLGTTSEDTHTLSYKIVPEDSGYQLKATYIANGDYENSVTMTTSETIVNKEQTIGDVRPSISDNNVKVYTIGASVQTASTDIYEFGYRKTGETGEIEPYKATATWGKTVEIGPLDRDTNYDIFVRKAKRTGYDASDWSAPIQKKTEKEDLFGNITYTGSTAVGDTITASYENGVYDYPGDDSTGSWQWYLNKVEVEGETSSAFVIKPMAGNPVVSVKYTADDTKGFKGVIEREFGSVYKPDYNVPTAAQVSAEPEDNTKEGSTLLVKNSETDNVYIYLKSSDDDTLPQTVPASEITQGLADNCTDNINRWIKTEAEMRIRVPANQSYIVYSARLEDDAHIASEISSARGILSAKEPLLRDPVEAGAIQDEDSTITWKALQEKTLTYQLYGKAPTGTWKFYVRNPSDDEDVWQNIDSELYELGRTDTSVDNTLKTTFQIPMKYKGHLVKAVLTGNGNYKGSVEFITPEIEGKLIDAGKASITKSDKTQLLDVLTATYTGTDDVNGIFEWYRKGTDSEAVKIKTDEANTTSSYQLQKEDLNCYVYAVYNAAPGGLFSGKAITDMVHVTDKAPQNKPDPVEVLQINGNSVQVKAPANYNRTNMDMIPQVVLGYQETDKDGNPKNNTVTWQMEGAYGETWFKKLKKNTHYVFYAKFLGTEVYAPTPDDEFSVASTVTLTENELFNESDLKITLEKSDTTKAATENEAIIGDTMHVSFTGDGYDEGYFSLSRSNGQIINDNVTNVVTNSATKTISFDYVYTYEDVGSNIIVSYTAKSDATHFDGTISKSNGVIVNKPMPTEKPEIPVLEEGLDTNLLVELKDGYEYYLSENDTPPDATSGDWDILEPNREDKPNYHDFRNLKRTTKYYLHARIAETKETMASASVTSEGVSPEPFIDMGKLDVLNMKDNDKIAMSATTAIEFPYTLNKENLTITNMTLTRKDETETAKPDNSVDIFKDADGNATRAVIEKGSAWADSNFAFDIKLYGVDGTVVSSTNGDKKTLVATNAKTMNLEVYRANAIAKGGTYVWQALVKDNEDHEALLQSEVIFSTDMKQVMPIKMEMNLIADTYLKQTSNTLRITNDGKMPVTVGVDKKTSKGTNGVPDLKGIYSGQETSNGEAYLKISNDNSNYTSRWNGVWLDTTLTDPSVMILAGLGDKASTSCYATGIADPTQSWPWPVDGKVIEQAYGIKFVTEISKEDIMMGTQEKKVFKEE